METFHIDFDSKEVYTLKNFSFDVINNGSADLEITGIEISDNISLNYIETPFTIPQNKFYTVDGYLKIINIGDSTGTDSITFSVSYIDEFNKEITDTYIYYLDYNGTIASNTYTQIFSVSNITYITNMLIINMEFNTDFTSQDFPTIVIESIDDTNLYIFSKVYRISANKLVYVFKDNEISNLMINDNIRFNLIHTGKELDINKISYRSI